MKRFRFISLKLIVVAISLIATNALGVELKIATLSPEGSAWMTKMRAGADEVSARTQGRVTFKFYPGGVMGDDKDVMRKMRFGQLHGGAFTNGNLNTVYPDVQIYNLIFKFQSLDEIDFVRAKLDPVLMKGLEDNGMVNFGFTEIGFAYLMSKHAIASVSDLRKQKVWVPENNFIAESGIRAFSVSPIPLPLRDVLVSMQTGMVDTVAGSAVGAIALRWHTQVKYITDVPLLYIYGILAIDKRAFAKISNDDQVIVRDIMTRTMLDLDKQSRKDNASATETLRKLGLEFVQLTPKNIEEMRATIASANEKLVESGRMSKSIVTELDQILAQARQAK